MTREERALAISTISWCDQLMADIQSGNGDSLEAAREFVRDWVSDMDEADVIVYLRQVRAYASQLLQEESNGSAEDEPDRKTDL